MSSARETLGQRRGTITAENVVDSTVSQAAGEGHESSSDEGSVDVDGPSRKRKRGARDALGVSCVLCKQRKVKCDRAQPSCGWCVRNGQPCEYKERKKPGLRAGYGRELEARLDRLEDVLQSHDDILRRMIRSAAADQPFYSASAPRPSPFPQPASPRDGVSRRISAMQAHSSDHAATRTQQGESPHISGLRFAAAPSISSPTFTHVSEQIPVTNMSVTPAASLSLHDDHAARSNALIPASATDLPPYDLLYSLVNMFFKHISPWCPILHRRATLDRLFGPSGVDEGDRILLHAIVATALRFSTDARLTPSMREHYHSVSKQRVILYGHENSSVQSLQALVILAVDVMGTSNGPPSWNLLALITRGVVQLGLNGEYSAPQMSSMYPSISTLRAMVLSQPQDFIEDESRRRLFWMVYLLDRYATIATAFEFALDDSEVERRLPCRDEFFTRNTGVETRRPLGASEPSLSRHADATQSNLGAFAYYIEVVGILSRIHRFLKKPVDIGALSDVEKWQREYRELDSCLNAWMHNLPDNLDDAGNRGPPEQKRDADLMYKMTVVTYHTAVIRLHSSAAYPTTRSQIFTPSYSASQRCRDSAEAICETAGSAMYSKLLYGLGPPFAFSIWVAARLMLVDGSTIKHALNHKLLDLLLQVLREMGAYWEVARRYAQLLQRVLDEYAESLAGVIAQQGHPGAKQRQHQQQGPMDTASAATTATPPPSVRILADMRRTAFDLDFLISQQPRRSAAGASSDHAAPKSSLRPPSPIPDRPTVAQPMIPSSRIVTPAPEQQLDYLDVFDFFNMPRLAAPVTGLGWNDTETAQAPYSSGLSAAQNGGAEEIGAVVAGAGFNNITNFMYDAEADWFVR